MAAVAEQKKKISAWRALGLALGNRKTGFMLLFGFASGLPFALFLGTLFAWLTEADVDLETMGIFSLIGLAYAFQFLWSPLIDKVDIPVLRKLGRRKQWIIPMQLLLGAILVTMSVLEPRTQLGMFSLLAGIGAFASATQDIAINAWRIDVADEVATIDILSTVYQMGYRLSSLVGGALDTSETVEPLKQIEKAEAALYEIAEGTNIGSDASTFKDASIAALKLAQKAMNSDRGLSGRTTGLSTIDDKTAGLHNSDLVILAGRPGMGKTSLATNIAFNTAYEYLKQMRDGGPDSGGAPVAFFSLEMSADQLATRILAEQAEISSEKLRSGDIGRDEFTRLSEASQRLADLPLYIDDTPALTIDALRMRARRLKRKNKIGLVVVDYLQLLQGSGRANDNRVNEISEISRGLKTMAKELELPVIALSQLSRAVEQREDKKPQLADLRESGSIEQDADMVWFIYRAEYYHKAQMPNVPDGSESPDDAQKYQDWMEEHQKLVNKALLIVAKQRHGSTGNVPLIFQSEYTKFSSPNYRDYSDFGEE